MKQLYRFINYFGIQHGIKLFIKFYSEHLESIRLPGYAFPFKLRKGTTDVEIFYQIYFNKCYHLNYPFEPALIIDAGANIGLATVYFKNRFPDSTIIAIEPEEDNYSLLLKNTKQFTGVYAYKVAIFNQEQTMYVNDIGHGESGYIVSTSETLKKIQTTTFPALLKKHNATRIDILKIDIEGSEAELFESGFEEWLPHTRCLIIETHDWIRKGSSKSVLKAISRYDFSLSIQGENLVFFNNDLL